MNSSAKKNKSLMIMAAGTGGHIFPGLAIAQTMQEQGWTVFWLGTQTGMEADIVPKHGIEIIKLNFTGLRGKGFIHSLFGFFKLIASFLICLKVMIQKKPIVVLGMGGYVTVPGGLAAKVCGKSLVLMNADAPLLLSNKALLPLANKLMFGLPSNISYANKKCIFTGNPLRKEICHVTHPTERYESRLGKLKILVVGGSLGAKAINELLPIAMSLIADEDRPIIKHQSGKMHVDVLKNKYKELGVDADVVDFIDDMSHQYQQADLLICRAGAITVSELTAVGVASILIPLVASSTSHQKANAEWLDTNGGAIHCPQNTITAESLSDLIRNMSREKCQQLAESAYSLGRRDASKNIAKILEELA